MFLNVSVANCCRPPMLIGPYNIRYEYLATIVPRAYLFGRVQVAPAHAEVTCGTHHTARESKRVV